ncbi:endonuclease/exonuclease/phosphatase family protein [Zunongwangia sp. HGR-M22]|uniref:endonuclease/exonuclease/phosphatase family protein n=1 Tax=Zunongwangia sp. HGR-M22 TaxID=3015168 RepID=UPI0022DCF96F|nr:endonuclease/exonuclease/phosphatase family protein [Zunongwangia sp. HGR-M22]WBL24064.1 endonuclease/exonuclease/phosphatase family protein [Zunongwangia sp. HGR-M22]
MKLRRFLQVFGIIAIVLTIFPFVAADYWWIRVFDFPHVQLTILTGLALLLYFIKFNIRWTEDYVFVALLIACLVVQSGKIYPYTVLAEPELGDSSIDKPSIKLLTANVLQKNKDHKSILAEVERLDPDLLILDETDAQWMKDVSPELSKKYPYKKEIPLDNTYGMLFYSKLKLIDPEVHYMVEDSIPSIDTKFIFDGDTIQFYSIHPTPPMPQHNPSSSDRDAEMMRIALRTHHSKYPVIVMGDFNDVAWSQTTRLFRKVGGLLDLRIGRGFYNTFNAKNIIMRWPLDHVFTTEEFRVKRLEVGKDISSDHFPAFAEITFEPERANAQAPEPPTEDQLKNAQKQIKEEKEEDQEKTKK